MDYTTLAAQAGVVWDDSNKFISGHIARVLLISGEGFYHPCTCDIGADHDALVPTANPESTEEAQYTPLPDFAPPIIDPILLPGTDPVEDSVPDSADPEAPPFAPIPDQNGISTDV